MRRQLRKKRCCEMRAQKPEAIQVVVGPAHMHVADCTAGASPLESLPAASRGPRRPQVDLFSFIWQASATGTRSRLMPAHVIPQGARVLRCEPCSATPKRFYQNCLLSITSVQSFDLLRPHLTRVVLLEKDVLGWSNVRSLTTAWVFGCA